MADQDDDEDTTTIPEADRVPDLGALPRSVEAVDLKINELRQLLRVVYHYQSIALIWAQIDTLLERRLLLEEAKSEGWSTAA